MKYDAGEIEKLGKILESFVNRSWKRAMPEVNKLLQALQITKEELVEVFRTIPMYEVVINRDDVSCLTLPNTYFVGYKSIDTDRLKKNLHK